MADVWERGSYTPLPPKLHGGRMTDDGPAPPREPSYRQRLADRCRRQTRTTESTWRAVGLMCRRSEPPTCIRVYESFLRFFPLILSFFQERCYRNLFHGHRRSSWARKRWRSRWRFITAETKKRQLACTTNELIVAIAWSEEQLFPNALRVIRWKHRRR